MKMKNPWKQRSSGKESIPRIHKVDRNKNMKIPVILSTVVGVLLLSKLVESGDTSKLFVE